MSAFIVITDERHANSVLMGHLNPKAPWDHIGALDASRVEVHSKGWMLPSSHLLVYESPQEAAKRILREQLETDLRVSGPDVVSETYTPKRFPDLPRHWDIEFIFKGKTSQDHITKPFAWSELAFVNLDSTKKTEIARSHEDILEYAGLAFKHPQLGYHQKGKCPNHTFTRNHPVRILLPAPARPAPAAANVGTPVGT